MQPAQLTTHATHFVNAALTLLLPVECGGCQTPDTRFCDRCAIALERECFTADERARPVDAPFPVFAAAPYAGLTRTCILNFKENQRTDLRRPLSQLLACAIEAALTTTRPSNPIYCVPIPSSPASLGTRGYRHVELLASTLRPAPTAYRWLRVARSRLDQVGLTEHERQHNAASSIQISPRSEHQILGRQVLLIDDIATTGASLRSAGAALERAGARVIAAAVIAHTEKLITREKLSRVPQG